MWLYQTFSRKVLTWCDQRMVLPEKTPHCAAVAGTVKMPSYSRVTAPRFFCPIFNLWPSSDTGAAGFSRFFCLRNGWLICSSFCLQRFYALTAVDRGNSLQPTHRGKLHLQGQGWTFALKTADNHPDLHPGLELLPSLNLWSLLFKIWLVRLYSHVCVSASLTVWA